MKKRETKPNSELCETQQHDTDAPVSRCATGTARRAAVPRHRTTETDEAFTFEVELPGTAPGDVELSVEDGVLALEGRTSFSQMDGVARERREFDPANWAGRWRLPKGVDVQGIASRLQHGLLTVTLPLAGPRRRSIPVMEG